MARCRVVTPDVVRLPLSDGEWIDVKRELNAGEYYDQLIATSDRQSFAKPIAYLRHWSFIDVDGAPLAYDPTEPEEQRRAVLRSLDKDTIREIIAVIDRHEKQTDKARAEKKTVPATPLASSSTFASAAP